ncbi:hypothetical protein [Catellatospora chokoriensis]|uniref:Uncharacterized protein n=1 Tax=Catellatospora chokoriensis TaxID=310353 RepID=A0A8J3NTL7_9ACTN|nr:hypothetical protein [Catellatospora chokoriensis]GIF92125.1 hypothetical protein Cch02nite_55690 [Catellatospora chokoriensis]
MTTNHDSDQRDVRLQIHAVELATADQLIAIVRCVAGPARLGTRFQRIGHADQAIDLALTKIEVYHAPVDELALGWTAMVTLTGTGAKTVYPGLIIEGGHLRT